MLQQLQSVRYKYFFRVFFYASDEIGTKGSQLYTVVDNTAAVSTTTKKLYNIK